MGNSLSWARPERGLPKTAEPEGQVSRNRDVCDRLVKEIDTNGDGKLSKQELLEWCRRSGFPMAFAADFVVVADTNQDGLISRDELAVLVGAREDALLAAFSAMDVDGDGVLGRQELRVGLQEMTIHGFGRYSVSKRLTPAAREAIVASIGRDEGIDFETFMAALAIVKTEDLATISVYKMKAHWNSGNIIMNVEVPCNRKQGTGYYHMIAGGVSGAVARVVTSPIDVVVSQAKLEDSRARDIARHIQETLGIRGFFRGCGMSVACTFPWKALDFFLYERFKRVLAGGHQDPTDAQRVLAGALGGATSQVVLYPLAFLAGRLQVDAHGMSLWTQATTVWRNRGLRGFYAGMSASLLGALPFSALTYGCYDIFKRRWSEEDGLRRTLEPWEACCCGAAAGWAGATCVYPLGVVGKRMGVQGMQGFELPWQTPYTSLLDAFRRIAQEEGVRTFFSGWSASSARILPSASVSFGLYEVFMNVLLADER